MSWKKALSPRQEIVLSSSSCSGNPHAIYVLSMGLFDEKLVIGACLMKTTLENITSNNRVEILGKDTEGYYRITGRASIYSSGKYLDVAISHSKPPMPEKAVVIDIDGVYNAENSKRLV